MNPDKAFWSAVASGAITPREACNTLIASGTSAREARELVFYAIGGSDLAETGADGVSHYLPSGKPVEEVDRALEGF